MAYRLRLFANVNLMQKWDLLRTFNNFFLHRRAVQTKETSGGPSGYGFGKTVFSQFSGQSNVSFGKERTGVQR